MKKVLNIALAAILLAVVFLGCKQATGKDKDKEKETEKQSYTITFDLDGGTVDPAIKDNKLTGKEGEKVEKQSNPTKEGYTFLAWEPTLPEKFPAKNISVKATWEAEKPSYTITLDLDGGILNPAIKNNMLTGKEGEEVKKPNNPTKKGYTFLAWEPPLPEKFPAKNLSVKATWEEYKPKISIKGDERIDPSSYSYETVNYAATWSEIKETIKKKVGELTLLSKYQKDYEKYRLCLNDKNATIIASIDPDGTIDDKPDFDDHSFTEDSVIYVVTNYNKFRIEKGTLKGYTGNQPSGTIYIPDGVTSIEEFAFQDCGSLTSITLPSSLTSIANRAFKDCSGLTSITFRDKLTSIGTYAFENCTSLTSITLPASLTSIAKGAFSTCIRVKNITISTVASLTSIGEEAFKDCVSLTSITFPDKLNSIEAIAFLNCSALTSITLPAKLISIDVQAFFACSKLANATFKDPTNWIAQYSDGISSQLHRIDLRADVLGFSKMAARYLTANYCGWYWKKEK